MLMIASLVCGLVFGAGLLISGMVQTTKVLGFLDIFGDWDPSLAVVMGAALAVSAPGFLLVRRRAQPLFAAQNFWPTKMSIDRPLVVGAALFGIGWGLVGLCPGPALENLATLSPAVIVFALAMAAGMVVHRLWQATSSKMSNDVTLWTAADG
ncbi:DUF6691 family protein [Tardiphaga sp. vice278]|uniref:DUF6691 family protein n=1 Tax=Tardiphaga sp. vice278 TaxID=2592815 RepID=UPI001AEEBE13|nr:DUF6691 family protein [Tardiphaga sp. vice278]